MFYPGSWMSSSPMFSHSGSLLHAFFRAVFLPPYEFKEIIRPVLCYRRKITATDHPYRFYYRHAYSQNKAAHRCRNSAQLHGFHLWWQLLLFARWPHW